MTPTLLAEIEKQAKEYAKAISRPGGAVFRTTEQKTVESWKECAKAMLALLCKTPEDKPKAFVSVVYVKMQEGPFTGHKVLETPLDLVDLLALASANAKLAERDARIADLEQFRTIMIKDDDLLRGQLIAANVKIASLRQENDERNLQLENIYKIVKQVNESGNTVSLVILEESLRQELERMKAGPK